MTVGLGYKTGNRFNSYIDINIMTPTTATNTRPITTRRQKKGFLHSQHGWARILCVCFPL